jgi:transposase
LEVSAKELVVALSGQNGEVQLRHFANTAAGHKALRHTLTRGGKRVRVVMEATGLYGLDVALTLSAQEGVELMVANPRAVRNFAKAMMQRSKNDQLDAVVLWEFAVRMPFQAWARPAAHTLALWAIARRLEVLTVQRTAEKNRQLRSIPGVGSVSAMAMLAELQMLPEDRDVRQWVAYAGLDPREYSSGTSVRKVTRISKVGNRHLRHALYMPALVASRHEPHLRGFYQHLLERGKKKMPALTAVARKLLHAIYGMFRSDQPYQGARVYQLPVPSSMLVKCP